MAMIPRQMGRTASGPLHVAKGIPLAVIAALTLACGSGSSALPSAPSPPAPAPAPAPTPAPAPPPAPGLVTITANGVSPKAITIAVGTRVTFVNNDSINHDIQGGPDPAHPDCHELDAVGFLTPGQRKQSDPLPTARVCEYHDHSFHSPLMNGTVTVQ
jgi:plastocyanin